MNAYLDLGLTENVHTDLAEDWAHLEFYPRSPLPCSNPQRGQAFAYAVNYTLPAGDGHSIKSTLNVGSKLQY